MKKYFFITSLIIVSLYACGDCEKSLLTYRDYYDLEVILTERPTINAEMNFVGTKINSDKVTTTKIMGRWYRNYRSYMEVGDTIIKRKGELTMYIHKKDTTLIFKWECEGKIYE